jgi:CRISPR-associated protein Cas2
MWVMVFFDLPTETKEQRRNAALFRKNLLLDGFNMFQFSIYTRHCQSRENAIVHINRVKMFIPMEGTVGIMTITDKQFGEIKIFSGIKRKKVAQPLPQLELF